MSQLTGAGAAELIRNGGGEAVIPDAVEAIEEAAFKGSGLTGISFGAESKLEKIGAGAFSGCKELVAPVAIPDSVITIEREAFSGSAVVGITFGPWSRLETVGESAFCECKQLTGVLAFPACVITMHPTAFAGIPVGQIEFTTVSTGCTTPSSCSPGRARVAPALTYAVSSHPPPIFATHAPPTLQSSPAVFPAACAAFENDPAVAAMLLAQMDVSHDSFTVAITDALRPFFLHDPAAPWGSDAQFRRLAGLLDAAPNARENHTTDELCAGWTALDFAARWDLEAAFFWLKDTRYAASPPVTQATVDAARASHSAAIKKWGYEHGTTVEP